MALTGAVRLSSPSKPLPNGGVGQPATKMEFLTPISRSWTRIDPPLATPEREWLGGRFYLGSD